MEKAVLPVILPFSILQTESSRYLPVKPNFFFSSEYFNASTPVRISPPSAVSSLLIHLSNVDLPEPDEPIIDITSPFLTLKVIPFILFAV